METINKKTHSFITSFKKLELIKKIMIVILLLATISIFLIVKHTKQRQEIRKEAAENTGINLVLSPVGTEKNQNDSFLITASLINNNENEAKIRIGGIDLQFDNDVFEITSVSCNQNNFPLIVKALANDDLIYLTCAVNGGQEPKTVASGSAINLGIIELKVKNTAPGGNTSLILKRINIPEADTSANLAQYTPNSFTYTVKAQETPPSTSNIDLRQGANLISIPLTDSTPLADALITIDGEYGKVFAFDNQAKQWKSFDASLPTWANSLTDVDQAMGLWVYVDSSTTMPLSEELLPTTTIPLYAGSNLVGYPSSEVKSIEEALSSISGKYTKVFEYDSSAGSWKSYDTSLPTWANSLTEMKPGFGYWIYVTEDCNLVVTNN